MCLRRPGWASGTPPASDRNPQGHDPDQLIGELLGLGGEERHEDLEAVLPGESIVEESEQPPLGVFDDPAAGQPSPPERPETALGARGTAPRSRSDPHGTRPPIGPCATTRAASRTLAVSIVY